MKKLLVILVLFISFTTGVYFYNNAPVGKNFTLQATDNRTVTLQDLHDKPSLIFFGYTQCPDICPITFLELSYWLDELNINKDDLNIWFFTVDPERDHINVLKPYIANFSNEIVGITGDPDEQFAALKSLGAFWKKVYYNEKEPESYAMNHTAGFMLLHKGGRLHSRIAFNEAAEEAQAKIKNLLGR